MITQPNTLSLLR